MGLNGADMKNRKWLYWIIIYFVLLFSSSVWAHGRHSHINLGFGIGGYYPGFYGPSFYGPSFYGYPAFGYDPFFYRPYYSYPPTVVMPVTPPVYIQQEQSRTAEPQTNYWHYCRDPEGYYPYVKRCPDGWLKVAPQPPGE